MVGSLQYITFPLFTDHLLLVIIITLL